MSNYGIVDFSNPGLIDPRVWATFGVSVKEGDSAIGQFGTGLKYAIAVLMREGRSLSIKSGDNKYVFGVESTNIRGKDFSQITCNDAVLPFTTHLGAKWELWQAYREIYSNCLDEGGSLDDKGETIITAEVGDIRHSDVFLTGKTLISSSVGCDVYAGKSNCIYYKGIRAQELSVPSLYTYDIKEADLTEDRTLKYSFEVAGGISNAVLISPDDDFVHDFMTGSKGWFEEKLTFDYAHERPSQRVIDLANQYRKEGIYLQGGLLQKALAALGAARYDFIAMNSMQSAVVDKASDFCASIGHEIEYPVLLAKDLGSKTLAMADMKTQQIYLSERVLSQGTKQVASTLIEENLHLKDRLHDCTYEMQTYLFDQIVTMGEKLTGEIL